MNPLEVLYASYGTSRRTFLNVATRLVKDAALSNSDAKKRKQVGFITALKGAVEATYNRATVEFGLLFPEPTPLPIPEKQFEEIINSYSYAGFMYLSLRNPELSELNDVLRDVDINRTRLCRTKAPFDMPTRYLRSSLPRCVMRRTR